MDFNIVSYGEMDFKLITILHEHFSITSNLKIHKVLLEILLRDRILWNMMI